MQIINIENLSNLFLCAMTNLVNILFRVFFKLLAPIIYDSTKFEIFLRKIAIKTMERDGVQPL